VHQSVLTACRADDAVAALYFALFGDGQRAMHSHPQGVRGQQGVPQPGRLTGYQPHIVDDLIEPGIGARSPVRVAGLDHAQSQRTRYDIEGRLTVHGCGDPAEPGRAASADREKPPALRGQEGIDASHLQGSWPKLLQCRRDARFAGAARPVQDDASRRHPARMPQSALGFSYDPLNPT
jgi:hypothetical protein